MEDNARMMLQMARLIASQSQSAVHVPPPVSEAQGSSSSQNLMVEVARQLLLSASNNLLASNQSANQTQQGDNNVPTMPAPMSGDTSDWLPSTSRMMTSQENRRPLVSEPVTSEALTTSSPLAISNAVLMNSNEYSVCGAKMLAESHRPPYDGAGPLAPSQFGPVRLKKKRGPKEKKAFLRYVYCLPHRNSRLPKFSSPNDEERSLIEDYQKRGYGYPAEDYSNGNPRRSSITINLTAEMFADHVMKLFPVLDGKLISVYRIDKQRRLLRVETSSPREVKNMNYQGTIVIVPYDNGEDRPAPILFRHSTDQCYITSYETPQESHTIATSTTTLGVRPDPPESNQCQSFYKTSPLMTLPVIMEATSLAEMEKEVDIKPTVLLDTEEINAESPTQQTGLPKLLEIAEERRQHLTEQHSIHIRPDHLIDDVIELYRRDINALNYDLHFFYHGPSGKADEIEPPVLFSGFWQQVLNQCFEGKKYVVPKLNLAYNEDIFLILGKILFHGLVLTDYWPVRISRACAVGILTGNRCSDRLMRQSLKGVMSDTELDVLENIQILTDSDSEYNSLMNKSQILTTLAPYGCTELPERAHIGNYLLRMASQHFYCKPYWSLVSMHKGICACAAVKLDDIIENDVIEMYSLLDLHPLLLMEKVTFLFSNAERENTLEKNVKVLFEKTLMKLNREELRKMLLLWCGCDCLSVNNFFVKFSDDRKITRPVFNKQSNVLVLSRYYGSVNQLQTLLDQELQTQPNFP